MAGGHLESGPDVECGVQLPEGLTFEWTVALTQCVTKSLVDANGAHRPECACTYECVLFRYSLCWDYT